MWRFRQATSLRSALMRARVCSAAIRSATPSFHCFTALASRLRLTPERSPSTAVTGAAVRRLRIWRKGRPGRFGPIA